MIDECRKYILLKATYDLLKKCDDGAYVKDALATTVFYDEADCDGFCLMEDIKNELENTHPEPVLMMAKPLTTEQKEKWKEALQKPSGNLVCVEEPVEGVYEALRVVNGMISYNLQNPNGGDILYGCNEFDLTRDVMQTILTALERAEASHE